MSNKTVWAFVVAPISVGILYFVFMSAMGNMSLGLLGILLNALVGYPIAIVIGIPVYILMSRTGAIGAISFFLVSILIFIVVYFVLFWERIILNGYDHFRNSLNILSLSDAFLLFLAVTFTVFVFKFMSSPGNARD